MPWTTTAPEAETGADDRLHPALRHEVERAGDLGAGGVAAAGDDDLVDDQPGGVDRQRSPGLESDDDERPAPADDSDAVGQR